MFVAHGKGRLCLTKGHLDNPKGQVEVESPIIEVVLTISIQIKKNVFWKKAVFNEASDPRTLYLSEIEPDLNGAIPDNITSWVEVCGGHTSTQRLRKCFHGEANDRMLTHVNHAG